MATTDNIGHVHDYRPVGKSYFKRDGNTTPGLGLPSHDQAVSYVTLFCPKCGDSKEIIAADHRPLTTEGKGDE